MARLVADEIRSVADSRFASTRLPDLRVSEKAPHDLVSQLDLDIGNDLAKRLTAILPGSTAFTEDGQGISGSSDAPHWIIDPIDGTANLIMGNTHYCVSVALEQPGGIVAGFIYHPPSGTMYWSVGNGLSYANDDQIEVSTRSAVEDAFVVFGFSANLRNIQRYHSEWTPAFEESCKGLGMLAPALNLCTVASGAVDAFVDFGCSTEGQAAGAFIVKNAGGVVANYDGSQWNPSVIGIYASNGHVRPKDLVNVAKAIRP